jgi:acyl dehydratase
VSGEPQKNVPKVIGSQAGTPRVPPPFGLGIRIVTQGRTITSGDFSSIVNASWEFSPMHSDAEVARSSVYGKPILGGPCLIAMGAGLSVHDLYYSWRAGGYDCYAALGIDEIRYHTPVVVDDTIRMEVEVAEFAPTPNGSAMFCRLNDVMRNQRDEIVLTMHRRYLLKGLSE